MPALSEVCSLKLMRYYSISPVIFARRVHAGCRLQRILTRYYRTLAQSYSVPPRLPSSPKTRVRSETSVPTVSSLSPSGVSRPSKSSSVGVSAAGRRAGHWRHQSLSRTAFPSARRLRLPRVWSTGAPARIARSAVSCAASRKAGLSGCALVSASVARGVASVAMRAYVLSLMRVLCLLSPSTRLQ